MKSWLRRCAILIVPLLASAASRGAPLDFNLGGYDKPTVLEGVSTLRVCTVTYLLDDYAANEIYAARMQFAASPNVVPRNGHMPCPTLVPPLVNETALNLCRDHADKKTDCVFADMSRGFSGKPELANTSEAASRCMSDQASQMAVACLNAGGSDVCNVGCGDDPAAAISAARQRCEATHQKACTITGVLPVSVPEPGR
jgi:hypothetical protein